MSAKNLQDKIAIVTGGTRGIGKAIVEQLLSDGARVAYCGTRQKSVDDAGVAFSPLGDAFGAVADVSKQDDVHRFFADVLKRYGSADILINNAGSGVFQSVADLTPENWRRTIDLNLSGVFYCCHEILPIFRQQGGGDVINISSLAGINPFAGGAAYNASKFGLNGFSEAMMLDHRQEGIRVSYIMPGSVDTEFAGNAPGSSTAWKIAPDDIAEVVSLLLRMPRRTTVSRVEIRPSRPPVK